MSAQDAWLSAELWDRAVDPDVPPGVVVFQDADGLWWRYPLIEFGDLSTHN